MKIEDEIDIWTEDDFKIPQVEIPPVDDPWAVDTRSSASNGAKSLLRDSEDNALSKEAAPSKPGIYVPTVDRIRPYAPSPSRQSNQDRTKTTAGSKDDSAQTDKDPWGFQIPSNRPLPRNLQDSSRPAPEDSGDTYVDWSLELEDEPFNLSLNEQAREPRDDADFDGYLADEPEITADYEADLHEELFQTFDTTHQIGRHLAIDEWFASVGQLDDETLDSITKILMNFSIRRFTSWMNWLRKQSWDELTLIKFFEFRQYYESRTDYWQYLQWSRVSKRWRLHENFYNFSLSKTLYLIEYRIHLPVNQMIEDEWLDDWSDLDVSYLYANGCLRFSDFALYRSQLSYSEDWKRRTDLGFDFESDLMLMTRDGGIRRFTPGRRIPYDQSEPTPSFDSDAWLEKLNVRNAIDQDNLGIDRSIGRF